MLQSWLSLSMYSSYIKSLFAYFLALPSPFTLYPNFISIYSKKKPQSNKRLRFKRKATTYSPTIGSTIGANGLNFSVRDGKR